MALITAEALRGELRFVLAVFPGGIV